MRQIEDRGGVIIKTENPTLPEAEKYRALNAAGAPVVRLLDVLEEGDSRKLVLEKAAPFTLDASRPRDFARLIDWMVDFNSVQVDAYPPCNLQYIQTYWRVTAQLLALAKQPDSAVFTPGCADLPDAAWMLTEFERVAAAGVHISHGDPAEGNLGMRGGEVVAFDLGLSWRNASLVDLVLRTGAQVVPYPDGLERARLVEDYAGRTGLDTADPWRDYNLCGAVLGAYFEQEALDEILSGRPEKPTLDWARITLERFASFAVGIC